MAYREYQVLETPKVTLSRPTLISLDLPCRSKVEKEKEEEQSIPIDSAVNGLAKFLIQGGKKNTTKSIGFLGTNSSLMTDVLDNHTTIGS